MSESAGIRAKLFDPLLMSEDIGGLRVGDGGLELDSLARIGAATAVSRFFGLTASGVDDYLLMAERLQDWADLVLRHFDILGHSADISFLTSGSSDRPKTICHKLDDLMDEIRFTASEVVSPVPDRIVALVPPNHIYGFLFTCLYPLAIKRPVIDLQMRTPTAVMGRLRKGDLVIGTPFDWRNLADLDVQFAPGVRGIVSAGPMSGPLWSQLCSCGLSALSEIYGSTETAGLGWRETHVSPFRLMAHLERSGDTVFRERTGEMLDIQDEIEWVSERELILRGRLDKMVQVAGVNVSLSHVKGTLLEDAGVADAMVRLDGDRLKAFIVPRDFDADRDALSARILRHVRNKLPASARPVRLDFGFSLPRNAMGKPANWENTGLEVNHGEDDAD